MTFKTKCKQKMRHDGTHSCSSPLLTASVSASIIQLLPQRQRRRRRDAQAAAENMLHSGGQCDQTTRLLFEIWQFTTLTITNLIAKQFCLSGVNILPNTTQDCLANAKVLQNFAKVAKFRIIWSHCTPHSSPHPLRLLCLGRTDRGRSGHRGQHAIVYTTSILHSIV